jgi:FkbM family methyltransferase
MQPKVWIQIGTYDGNDKFQKMVRQEKPDLVILVEPNPDMNNLIRSNYVGVENIIIRNVAITDVNKGWVKLVYPRVTAKVRPSDEKYNKLFSLLPMDDWGSDFKTLRVQSESFMELCERYGIVHIDLLQIDTEGYDVTIIKSINFEKVKINKLIYEQWNFTTDCFTRYGKNAKHYGLGGMKEAAELLTSLRYNLENEGTENVIATKI